MQGMPTSAGDLGAARAGRPEVASKSIAIPTGLECHPPSTASHVSEQMLGIIVGMVHSALVHCAGVHCSAGGGRVLHSLQAQNAWSRVSGEACSRLELP